MRSGFEQSSHVVKLMREAAGIVKRQSRFLRLFTTLARPKHRRTWRRPRSASFANDRTTCTVQHGLNLSSCTIATISIITHCTPSSRHPYNGAPAVATRKHAPIGAQATVETASTVGRWQDAGRDKSKRPQCAKCTRRTHAAANVHDQAQAEQP